MDFMDNYFIGIVVLIAAILVARLVNEKGMKALTTEEKGVLVEAFADIRKYQLIPILILIIAYFFLMKQFPEKTESWMYLYFVALLLILLIVNYIVYNRMKKYNLPQTYLKNYMLSTAIKTGGILVFFVLMVSNLPR